MSAGPGPTRTLPLWTSHTFTGLTWKGIGLIVLLCAINGVRRTIQNLFGDETWSAWLVHTAQLTALGLIIALPVAVAVVATYNLGPSKPVARYFTLALAVAASSMMSVAIAVVIEAFVNCGGFPVCDNETPRTLIWSFIAPWARYGSLCALFTVVFVYLRTAEESTASETGSDCGRLATPAPVKSTRPL